MLFQTEVKGAHGYTPSKGTKVTGPHLSVIPPPESGLTRVDTFYSQEDAFEDVEQLKAELHSASMVKSSPGNRWSSKVGRFCFKM